jgi:uncharacterized protein YeaO (DUF488 family)
MIRIKRTYDPPAAADGRRILVERLWPRGMKKDALAADAWLKSVAPSTQLRRWFGHQVERWDEFRERYGTELDRNPAAWEPILDAGRDGTVTLLYSAHDVLHNSAVVLRDYLARRESARPAPPKAVGRRQAANTGRARAGSGRGRARAGARRRTP